MFAARRKIFAGKTKICTTPLLVPSFSSKGFPEVNKIISTTSEIITGAALISAYDLYYDMVDYEMDFPEFLFIDSGGYEASKDTEIADLGYLDHEAKKWNREMHSEVLANWIDRTPTVAISYDHPKEKCSIQNQIERASDFFGTQGNNNRGKELLLKPETENQFFINIENVIEHIPSFSEFNIIGFTEKELGKSILDRMKNIARIRIAMNKKKIFLPLHIFGSLDTITTPLYFLSGADIFDGLTWLRLAYLNGITSYIQNYSALELGIQTKDQIAIAQTWSKNYYYLSGLELEMKQFINEGNFDAFKFNSELFKNSVQYLVAKLEED
ncbi:MAG: hypothetical protein GKR93_12585 [Gammaproteobacteria bacterium]|nr:hypothetical protein [Gammaproteobacteria bacterium]